MCFILVTLTLHAQPVTGNEWIKAGQPYLKFSVSQPGIYRVSYQAIRAADPSFLQTDPAHWQLFFRGQELAIRVVGQQDGVFDAQDMVEFYGEGNDGSQDALLYRPRQRLHPYQSLFSDTAAYFLTSCPSAVGKRMSEPAYSSEGLSAEPFHLNETVQAFTSDYTFNNLKGIEPSLQQSYFEPGEGWSGPLIRADSVGKVSLDLTGLVSADWPITLEGLVNGRSNVVQQVRIELDKPAIPLAPLSLTGFMSQSFRATIDPKAIQTDALTLRFRTSQAPTNAQFSVTYVKLTFPQTVDMASQTAKVFHLRPNARQTSLLTIPHAPPAAMAYDITDKANCRLLPISTLGTQMQVLVGETGQPRDVLVTNQIAQPLHIRAVRFNLTVPPQTDYVIITHASLRQAAETYAAFRASDSGGNHRPFVVEADSLYNQYNYGEKSPLALRRFADFLLTHTAVKNLFLIGRACSYPYLIKTTKDDLVPTVGYPGSDILLTAGLGGYPDNTPAIPTGRLSVTTPEQVLAYLEKVKQLELSTPNDLWRKHIIHISGGKSTAEAQTLRATLSSLGTTYQNGLLGGQVSSFSKRTSAEVEPINIAPLINDGVSLITFFGHAGPGITDMDFGLASALPNGFHNPVYPFMIFNGCGVGEIFSHFNTLSTDWLLAPQKGAALVLAHSYWSFQEPNTRYLNQLYSALFTDETTLGMPFGKVQQQLNRTLDREGADPYLVSVLLQMILQGDPALSLYPLPKPDFSVDKRGIYLERSVVGTSPVSSDSLRLVIPLANLGKFVAGQAVSLALTQTTATTSTRTVLPFTGFRYRDTLVYQLARDTSLRQIDVSIDPDNRLAELDKTNNRATLTIDWSQVQENSRYPIDAQADATVPMLNVLIDGAVKQNNAVVGLSPRLDVYLLDNNPLVSTDTSALEAYLTRCATCQPQRLPAETFARLATSARQLQFTTHLALEAGSTYELLIFGKDAAGNRTLPPYRLTLNTVTTNEPVTLRIYPNPATLYTKFDLTLNRQDLPTTARLQLYNPLGVGVFDDLLALSTGSNTFFWQGSTPGLYVYALRLTWQDGRTQTHTGQVIWQP